MGCFNISCGISHLPIMVNDDVVVIFLQVPRRTDEVVGCSQYLPLPLYIEGKYNDYGSVEDVHGVALPRILRLVKDHLVEQPDRKLPNHKEVLRKNVDIEFLFELESQHCLALKHPDYVLTQMLVRKNVFDSIIANMRVQRYHPTVHKFSYNDAMNEFDTYYSAWCRHFPHSYLLEDETDSISYLLNRVKQYNNIISVHELLFPMFSLHLAGDKVSKQDLHDTIENITKMKMLASFMFETGQPWAPSIFLDQSQDTTNQTMLASIIIDESEVIKNRGNE